MDQTNQNQIPDTSNLGAANVSNAVPIQSVSPNSVEPQGVSFYNTSFNKAADVTSSVPVEAAISAPAATPAPVVPAQPSALVDSVDFNMNKPAMPQVQGTSSQVSQSVDSALIATEEATILPKAIGIPASETTAANLDFSYPDDETEEDSSTTPTSAPSPVMVAEQVPAPEIPVKPQEPVAAPTAPVAPKPVAEPASELKPQKDFAQITKNVDEINKKPEGPSTPAPATAPVKQETQVQTQKADTRQESAPVKQVQAGEKPKGNTGNTYVLPSKNKSANSTSSYPYKIEQLLDMVVQKNASDLHIAQGYPAMLRIDSMLTPVSQDIIDQKAAEDLIYPLMEQDKRDMLEVNREVDFGYSFGGQARFRINAYFERKQLAAAMRMIPTKIKTLEDLNLPKIFNEIVKLPQGLVLVTGPTGSGKSTTLAAMIDEINKQRADHIVTIEDPIEYIYSPAKAVINQREMHEDTNSWEIALRSVLRQDPDVVLVGEMRDFETIAAALTVAETGHLVFATLHTNSAAQSIDRIIDVFPEFQQSQVRLQLSNVIEAVVAQRLVPVIGGGRRAVTEVMLATPAVRNLIREGKTEQIDNTIRTGIDVGMTTLEQSLVQLVREGKLSLEDAQMHTTKPDEVLRLVKG